MLNSNAGLEKLTRYYFFTFTAYIEYWLSCIHAHATSDKSSADLTSDDKKPSQWPPVLIVCTHQDVSCVINKHCQDNYIDGTVEFSQCMCHGVRTELHELSFTPVTNMKGSHIVFISAYQPVNSGVLLNIEGVIFPITCMSCL